MNDLRAEMRFRMGSGMQAKRVHDILLPDNMPLPPGLEITMNVKGTNVLLTIKCKRSIVSFRETIEDILSSLDLAIRTDEAADSI